MRVLLFHQYAGNKGDRAVAYALCRLLNDVFPDAEITISTSDPSLWQNDRINEDFKVSFIPQSWDYSLTGGNSWYWSLLNKYKKYTFSILRELYLRGISKYLGRFLVNSIFYKKVKSSDLIISVGGHHFTTLLSTDLVSGINFDAMSVLSQGKKFACFSQSFGPFKFNNPRNLLLTKKILNNSILFSREGSSTNELVAFLDRESEIMEVPETVIGLNILINAYKKSSERTKKVGIAIYATKKRSDDEKSLYIRSIAETVSWLSSVGYAIEFFPMEIRDTEPDDRPMINEIISLADERANCLVHDDMCTINHLKAVSECRFFIGHKTHSVVFSLTTGTPLVSIAYHPKTREFMKQYDMEQYCIDEDFLTSVDLIGKIKMLQENLDVVGYSLYETSKKYSSQLLESIKTVIKVK